jgi:NAD(P)-dependent dehydrogenase (short-subunit alcohol dehydrogenase family)
MSAQARRVLVVTAGESDGLPEAIHDRVARTRAEVLVVTPATSSRLRHLLSDVDAARETAGERACRCAEELRLSGFDAEAIVGDSDPVQAIEDALALFHADVVVVDGDLADRARRRIGLPIVPLADAA